MYVKNGEKEESCKSRGCTKEDQMESVTTSLMMPALNSMGYLTEQVCLP